MTFIKNVFAGLFSYIKEMLEILIPRLKELKTTLFGEIYDDVLRFAANETRSLTVRPEMPNYEEYPPDLQDSQGLMNVTADGYAISGRLTINDVKHGSTSPVVFPLIGVYLTFFYFVGLTMSGYLTSIVNPVFWCGFWFVVMLLVSKFSGLSAGGKIFMSAFYILFAYLIFLPSFANIPKYSGFLIPFLYGTKSGFPVIAYIPPIIAAITPWLLNLTERRERRDELLKSAEDGAVLQSGVELHRAKELQLKATKKDDTPFIRFGTSMGVLRKKGDNFAPDPKMPMGFTAKDALTHMIITGATGSGKTFNGFRPYAKQWIEQSCGGCVIMDGKGELASDLAKDIPAINIISPDTSSFSIVAGLSPEDVTLGIMETQTKESSNTDPLWDGLAETLLRYSAILLEGAVERDPDKEIKWTLYNIHQVVNNENFRQRCAAVIKDSMQNDEVLPTHLADAGNYWRFEFSGIPDKQRSSVITHVSRWLSPFLSNRELRAWAAEDDGIDITQALHGEVFGLCLPKAKYGLAGVAITNLAKMRLYNAAIKRGSHWQDDPGQTPCLIIIDEAQEVLADHDEEFPAIARSLGLALCYGTQTLDQFIERLKGKTEDRAFGFFEQFRSFMTFKSSKATYNYYSDRIGESRLIQSLFPQTAVDYDVALNQIAASPISDPNHPEKRALRKSRSVVFDALKNKTVEKMQAIIPGQQEDRPGERPLKNMEYKLVVEPHDFTDVLAGQYVCLCSFNRAGLDRRDFVVCDYKEE